MWVLGIELRFGSKYQKHLVGLLSGHLDMVGPCLWTCWWSAGQRQPTFPASQYVRMPKRPLLNGPTVWVSQHPSLHFSVMKTQKKKNLGAPYIPFACPSRHPMSQHDPHTSLSYSQSPVCGIGSPWPSWLVPIAVMWSHTCASGISQESWLLGQSSVILGGSNCVILLKLTVP